MSQLAKEIETSRATVMNYIKYLADARLINMFYPKGSDFPKKPSRVLMQNSNLIYSIYPMNVKYQDILITFFANALWKDHKVNKSKARHSLLVDEKQVYRVLTKGSKIKQEEKVLYAIDQLDVGKENNIPLWLFGFLY